jgi:hypothetical protein
MSASKGAKLLEGISNADIATSQLVEMIEKVFHIEDLFKLAQHNSFVALNFWELICNIDYVVLSPGDVTPIGAADMGAIPSFIENVTGAGGRSFKLSIKGKVAAVAECFRLQALKMDSLITTEVISAFMQGTGAAQIAQDAINAFANGGMQILKMGAADKLGIPAELAKKATQ